MKRVLTLLVALLLLTSFSNTIFAEDEKPSDDSSNENKYRVTIDAGLQGTINDNPRITFYVEKGRQITLDSLQEDASEYVIKLNDGVKYYFKGYHIAGEMEENADASFKPYPMSFPVDRDMDLVATYGVKGNQIAYTVRYIDKDTGAKLHDDDIYYGNEGDSPVVPARHISASYVPRGYNYTTDKTLGSEPIVITIEYTHIGGSGGGEYGEDVTYVYEEIPGGGGTGGGGTAPVTPAVPEPEQIINIDDNPTPLTPGDDNNNNNNGNEPTEPIEPEPVPTANFWQTLLNNPLLLISGGILTFGLLAFIIFLLMRRRREDD